MTNYHQNLIFPTDATGYPGDTVIIRGDRAKGGNCQRSELSGDGVSHKKGGPKAATVDLSQVIR